MKKRIIVIPLVCLLYMHGNAQQSYTGSNACTLRLETNVREYQFTTGEMSGRLNEVMDRFEFIIPISSMKSTRDSSDLQFLKSIAGESNVITITASLPEDADTPLDLSYFNGNKSIALAGELRIGSFTLEDDTDFNGMLIGSAKQCMAFDFKIFVNTSRMNLKRINNEQLLEVEFGARGDKLNGLTTN